MRRAALVLAVLATAASGVTSGAATGASPGAKSAALPRCSKPAAKVAKQPGGAKKSATRRKCRFSGWWPAKTLAGSPGTAPLPAGETTGAPAPTGTAPTPAPTTPTTPQPAPLPRRVQVDEGEWYVRPSRKKLGAGSVEVNITNFGEDAHDLAIDRNGTSYGKVDLAPGDTKQLIADLPAGTYKLYCTLQNGDHEAAGMKSTITVE
jgi:plastocyanin